MRLVSAQWVLLRRGNQENAASLASADAAGQACSFPARMEPPRLARGLRLHRYTRGVSGDATKRKPPRSASSQALRQLELQSQKRPRIRRSRSVVHKDCLTCIRLQLLVDNKPTARGEDATPPDSGCEPRARRFTIVPMRSLHTAHSVDQRREFTSEVASGAPSAKNTLFQS